MNYYIRKGDVKIGAFDWTGIRKKPVLAIERENSTTKYASFNNEEAVAYVLEDREECKNMTNAEFDDAVKRETAMYDRYWRKVIAVYATN